jgi:hypothetical protein
LQNARGVAVGTSQGTKPVCITGRDVRIVAGEVMGPPSSGTENWNRQVLISTLMRERRDACSPNGLLIVVPITRLIFLLAGLRE